MLMDVIGKFSYLAKQSLGQGASQSWAAFS